MFRNLVFPALLVLTAGLPLASGQLDQLSANDKDFIEFAGECDLASVRLGSLAQSKSSNPGVKALGRTLEREHGADLRKLTAISNRIGGIAPNTLDEVHVSAIKRLTKQKGDDFDHAFLKLVVNEHENALVSFKREADHGASPELQGYAKSLLPHLETHLKQAKKLDSSAE